MHGDHAALVEAKELLLCRAKGHLGCRPKMMGEVARSFKYQETASAEASTGQKGSQHQRAQLRLNSPCGLKDGYQGTEHESTATAESTTLRSVTENSTVSKMFRSITRSTRWPKIPATVIALPGVSVIKAATGEH